MDIKAGIILNKKRQTIIWDGSSLLFWQENRRPSVIVEDIEDVSLLTACPDGKHFAFWTGSNEAFKLMDLRGQTICTYKVNTDKNSPSRIYFTPSGRSVAFIDFGDYGDNLCLYDIRKKWVTRFNSSSPIGYGMDLQYFVEAPLVPPLWAYEGFFLYEYDEKTGKSVRVSREEFIRRQSEQLKVIDNRRVIKSYAPIPFHGWTCLAIQKKGTEFTVLRDRSLFWFLSGSPEPDITVDGCTPDSIYWYYCNLTVNGDLALVQAIYEPSAILVNRNAGVVWKGENISEVKMKEKYIITRHTNGNVEVVDVSGNTGVTTSMVESARPGLETVAADVIDNTLYIAYYSGHDDKLEIFGNSVRYAYS